jgi:hypothetical protein
MRQSVLETDEKTGLVSLTVHVDTSDTDRLNAEERISAGKGFSPGGLFRAAADIPEDFLMALFMLGDRDAVPLKISPDPMERKRALRGLLARYPEFRISEGEL